jgi:hypothetical protein
VTSPQFRRGIASRVKVSPYKVAVEKRSPEYGSQNCRFLTNAPTLTLNSINDNVLKGAI